jgi:hypothetical protein
MQWASKAKGRAFNGQLAKPPKQKIVNLQNELAGAFEQKLTISTKSGYAKFL